MMPINSRVGTLALLLALIGCGGPGATAGGEDGREAADRFLEEVRAGRIEPAWQSTSTEFKSLMGLESLRELAQKQPALKGQPEHIESKRIDRDGLPLTEHAYRAQGKARNRAVTSTLRVIVSQGDDGWKVEKLSVE